MSQVKIRSALEGRVKAFATEKSIPVMWENIGRVPSGTHLRVFIYRSPTQDPSIGADHKRYKGIMRVQVWHVDIGKGTASVETLAEELANYFPRALKITQDDIVVNIENTPSQGSVSTEATWVVVSVEMVYRADVITI